MNANMSTFRDCFFGRSRNAGWRASGAGWGGKMGPEYERFPNRQKFIPIMNLTPNTFYDLAISWSWCLNASVGRQISMKPRFRRVASVPRPPPSRQTSIRKEFMCVFSDAHKKLTHNTVALDDVITNSVTTFISLTWAPFPPRAFLTTGYHSSLHRCQNTEKRIRGYPLKLQCYPYLLDDTGISD